MIANKFKLRITATILFLLTFLASSTYPLFAQSAEPKVIRVAAYVCPPFVTNDNDQFSGTSMFLWDNIAEKLGLEYKIERLANSGAAHTIFKRLLLVQEPACRNN